MIKKINLLGDFFIVGDMDGNITARLKNVRYTREDICEVLPDDLSNIIMNLKKEDLINLITK